MTDFLAKLAAAWPPSQWQSHRVLVAVSGGADSVALLCGLQQLAPQAALFVGHFNHGWRANADEDAQFVADLARQLRLPAHIGQAPTSEHDPATNGQLDAGGQKEEVARRQRYSALQGFALDVGARYLVTAHHAEDQAETVLHRILRGTGISGLSGVPRFRLLTPGVTLLRPLLDIRRDTILSYLEAIGQSYRSDETNRDLDYTRNRLRLSLLPQLAKEYNPRVIDALLRLADLSRDQQTIVDYAVNVSHERLCTFTPDDQVVVEGRGWNELPIALRRAALVRIWERMSWPQQSMSYARWDELASLTDGPASQLSLPGAIQAVWDERALRLVGAGLPAGPSASDQDGPRAG